MATGIAMPDVIPEELRRVYRCPQCGGLLIASPVLQCAHCGEEVTLRSFVYPDSERRGYIAECIDLDLLCQGLTPDDAVRKLQEAVYGYLQVAFSEDSTKGLVLRSSPLSHRLRYRLQAVLGKVDSFIKRRHPRHLLPKTSESKSVRFSHC